MTSGANVTKYPSSLAECPVGRFLRENVGPFLGAFHPPDDNYMERVAAARCSGPLQPVALDLDSEWRERFPHGAVYDLHEDPPRLVPLVAGGPFGNALIAEGRVDRSLESLLSDPRRYIEACEAHAALIGWKRCGSCQTQVEGGWQQPDESCSLCNHSPVPGYLLPKLTLPDGVLGDWKAMRAEFGLAEVGAAA